DLQVYNGRTTSDATVASPPMHQETIKKFTFTGALRSDLSTRIASLRAARINGRPILVNGVETGWFDYGVFTQLFVEDSTQTPTGKIRSRHPNIKALNVDTAILNWSVRARIVFEPVGGCTRNR